MGFLPSKTLRTRENLICSRSYSKNFANTTSFHAHSNLIRDTLFYFHSVSKKIEAQGIKGLKLINGRAHIQIQAGEPYTLWSYPLCHTTEIKFLEKLNRTDLNCVFHATPAPCLINMLLAYNKEHVLRTTTSWAIS